MTRAALRRPGELLAELVSAAETTAGDELRAVLVKGSLVAHGGQDFLPYFSDIDCHLYLASTAMRSSVTPRLDVALAIQERLGRISASHFHVGSWSLAFWDEDRLYEWSLQPLPGLYEVVAGQLPATFREGRVEEYMDESVKAVRNAADSADRAVRYCADLPDDRLEEHLRSIASWVKTALVSAASVATGDVAQGWQSPLADVLRVVEPEIVPSGAASAFYADLRDWPAVRTDAHRVRGLLELGVTILDEIHRHFEVDRHC